MLSVGLIHALPPHARRGHDRKEAASYIGVSATTFDRLVRDGVMPKPAILRGRKVCDVRLLDRAFDKLSQDQVDDTNEIDRILGLQ